MSSDAAATASASSASPARWSRRCWRRTTTWSAFSTASASIRCLRSGLNIVVGFAGLLDIGYVAFFGIGSYAYAFLASPHFGLHLPFVLAMVDLSRRRAPSSGILIGAPTLRLRGDYLAIVTLGFGEITYILLVNLDRPINITGGPSGLISIDPPSSFGYVVERNIEYYYLFLLTLGSGAARLGAAARLAGSAGPGRRSARTNSPPRRWGSTPPWRSCRPSRSAPRSRASPAALLASWQRSVFPDNFLFQESINILAMVILGGMGSVPGRHPGRRSSSRIAGDFSRPRALPAAGVRRDADGADDLPPAGFAAGAAGRRARDCRGPHGAHRPAQRRARNRKTGGFACTRSCLAPVQSALRRPTTSTAAATQVTVSSASAGAALETSFGNGGVIHASEVEPWSQPGMPLQDPEVARATRMRRCCCAPARCRICGAGAWASSELHARAVSSAIRSPICGWRSTACARCRRSGPRPASQYDCAHQSA